MTGGGLLILAMLVSAISLIIHVAVLALLWRQKVSGETERVTGKGYVRTAACRVLAATVYVTADAFQLAGARVMGGDLTPEALLIFTFVQILWTSNAVADVRTLLAMARRGRERRAAGNVA